ncbi:MAG TPA: DUF4198 domain-containing protein [Gemmatimonadaceae bacterium]
MRRLLVTAVAAAIVVLFATRALEAHDLFLRTGSFFVGENATVVLQALNGTFSKSENSITRDRLMDLSVVGPSGRSHIDTTMWSATGDTSRLTVRTGSAGTYVVGVSLGKREIALKAAEFNQYLTEDGIPDVLAARKRSGALGKDARERYSKHVKAILQVGATRTNSFAQVLGYPAELVPVGNPYNPRAGGWLRVLALVDGKPVANQLVITGGRPRRGGRFAERRLRTDASGIVRVRISEPGFWYVKFIHMERVTSDPSIDYESKWATLTFQVR